MEDIIVTFVMDPSLCYFHVSFGFSKKIKKAIYEIQALAEMWVINYKWLDITICMYMYVIKMFCCHWEAFMWFGVQCVQKIYPEAIQ